MYNDTTLYEIFDYYHIPFWQKPWFLPSMITIGIITVTAIIFFVIKRKQRKTITPWEWAKKELSLINTETYKTSDDFKKLYYKLTNIIKIYLEKRYKWSTHEKTDEELIAFLEYQKFDPDMTVLLKKVTDEALWIKFAKQGTLKTQADTDINIIQTMIERTTPAKK